MNLVLDIGNTRIKVAFFNQGELINKDKVAASDLKAYVSGNKFDFGIISSVKSVKEINFDELNRDKRFIFLNQNIKLPITNFYLSPNTLGNDRLANAVGAFSINPNKNSLVIDAGTCLKFDFISAENQYFGGAISPGLKMRAKALHTFTDKLPLIELLKPVDLIGNSTEAAMASGIVNGIVAEINKIIEAYSMKYKQLQVFITGGDAEFLYPMVDKQKSSIFAHDNITLVGLNRILEENVS